MNFVISIAKPIIGDEPMCKQGACNNRSRSVMVM